MEAILARPTGFSRKSAVHDTDDSMRISASTGCRRMMHRKCARVANSTFYLAFKMKRDILLEMSQPIDNATILWTNFE